MYLSGHADDAKKAAVASKRGVLVTVYTTALAKVDPADEAKGKPALAQALNGVKTVAAEAGTAQKAAEKVFADWTVREPKLEAAAGKIVDMEEWGYQKVAPLRTQLDAVRGPAEARSFDLASTAADQLLAASKPVIDDYEKQKTAQAKYEPARDALADRIAKATGNDRDRLQPERDAVGVARDTMETSAKEKNFVQALEQVGDLTGKLKAFEVALEELDRKKTEFETANAELQLKLTPVQQSTFRTLEPKQQEIAASQTALDAAAEAEDYDQAMTLASELANKCEEHLAEVEKLEEQRKAYDTAWAALQPRLPTTSEPGGERIVALQQAIASQSDEMTAAAEAEDYDTALRLADELELELTELETAVAARQRYDEQWAALQPKLSQATTGSPALADLESRIDSLRQQSETAAAADDYEQACTHLTALEATLAEYETAAAELQEKKQAYEQARAALEQHLPTSTEPGEGRLAEVQTEIQQSLAGAEAAEAYETALEHIKALEGQLAELETLLAARDEYKAKLAQLEARLPTRCGAAAGRLAEVQLEIETLRADAEAAAGSSDFEAALKALTELEGLLTEYEDLSSKRDQFEQRWTELQPRMPDSTAPDATPKIIELNDSIVQTRSSLEAKAAKGEYEDALSDIDELVRLLSDLEAAKAEAVRKREEFEQAYAGLKQVVEQAVSTPTDVPAVQEKQDELTACKAEVDAAVAQNDYDTAQALLEDVNAALKAYEEELRKEPRNCDWINATATALMAGIMRHYMQAQSKIDRAAQAYDEALAAHKKAVDAVDAKKQLAADLLIGIFFAGLGGAVGGAVAGGMKSTVEGAFKKAAASGAILDATKDVAKFTTRSLQQLGGSPGDPTSVQGNFGGSGVELARNIGQAVNSQGEALLGEVEKLANLVRDNPEACDSKEGVRVEGDPAASIGSDPFLQVLGSIKSADKRDFAERLWGSWINEHAYSIDVMCIDGLLCSEVVEDNIEDFFGWWADLVQNIEAQTGADFGLRARLDEARRQVQERIDARNR